MAKHCDIGSRIAIFVDVQNVFYSARSIYNGKLDYGKMLDDVIGERELVRSIAYVVQRPDIKQDSFYEALARLGFEVRVKEAKNKVGKDGRVIPVKGSYEVPFSVDAISIAPKVDTIILVTGNGNYFPLISFLKAHGVRVELVGFSGSTAGDLIKTADEFIAIPKAWTFEVEKAEKVERGHILPDVHNDEDFSSYEDEEEEVQPVVAGQPAITTKMGIFD